MIMKISPKNGKLVLDTGKVSAKSDEQSADSVNTLSKKVPDIAETMKSFPLKEGVFPPFSSKKDLRDVKKHRISYADVYNADAHIYAMLAQTLHVFANVSIGLPANWSAAEEDYVGNAYIDSTGEPKESFNNRKEKYTDMLMDLRDQFIWLHDNDANSAPYEEGMYAPGELEMFSDEEEKEARAQGIELPLFRHEDKELAEKRRQRDNAHAQEYARRKEAAFKKLSEEIDMMWD